MVIFIKCFVSYINNIIKNVAQAGLACGCGNTTCRFFHFFDTIKSVKKRKEKTFELNEVRSRASRPDAFGAPWENVNYWKTTRIYMFFSKSEVRNAIGNSDLEIEDPCDYLACKPGICLAGLASRSGLGGALRGRHGDFWGKSSMNFNDLCVHFRGNFIIVKIHQGKTSKIGRGSR